MRHRLWRHAHLQTESLYRDILTDRPALGAAAEHIEPAADRPSIAVLPFSNLSRDADLDHLCEGLAEDIITGLGRFHMLFVIDRYSSSMIAKQETDIAAIGKRLGVAHLVQGSLQRQGDRVRVTTDSGRQIDVAVAAATGDELPPGLLFIAYGDLSSRLMDGDTHGSGMPTSKGFDVTMEKLG